MNTSLAQHHLGPWRLLLVAVTGLAGPPSARAGEATSQAPGDVHAPAEGGEQRKGWGITGYPILFFSPETKTALGGGLALYNARPRLRPDVTELEVFGTQMRQIELNIKQTTFLQGNGYELSAELRINRSPKLAFFGVGPDTPDSWREEYLDQAIVLAPRFTAQIAKDLFLGPAFRVAAFSARDLAPGGLLEKQAWAGGREALAIGAGMTARLETTDSSFFPTRGFRTDATALLYRQELGSDHDFFQLALSHRHYVGLGGNHVLAFQGLATFSAGTVPWQMLPRLGGMFMLRGYYDGRHRDKHYVAAQAEYRFPVYWRISGAIFTAVGEVAGAVRSLGSGPLRASGGGGLRILLDRDEHINLRADIAVTAIGHADFYIAMMEAF